MMQVSAHPNEGPNDERRGVGRFRANLMAIMRRQRQPNEAIQIVSISAQGCGFRSRRPVAVGTQLWLGLPGLETWEATVAWYGNGQGGMRFERPLDLRAVAPLVSERGSEV